MGKQVGKLNSVSLDTYHLERWSMCSFFILEFVAQDSEPLFLDLDLKVSWSILFTTLWVN